MLYWSDHPRYAANFGDAASPMLVSGLSGLKVLSVNKTVNIRGVTEYAAIGSILQWVDSRVLEVWGSGFISRDSTFKIKPRRVHAVRGPLTRELCVNQGVECPQIYGDPAMILFSKFKTLKREPIYELGIVPHYVDAGHKYVRALARDRKVRVIDVLQDPYDVAREYMKCRYIASSSLHGVILADVLSIPSRWISISGNVSGKGFKFIDYYRSVLEDVDGPLFLQSDSRVQQIVKEVRLSRHEINLNDLLGVCPFLSQGISSLEDVSFGDGVSS